MQNEVNSAVGHPENQGLSEEQEIQLLELTQKLHEAQAIVDEYSAAIEDLEKRRTEFRGRKRMKLWPKRPEPLPSLGDGGASNPDCVRYCYPQRANEMVVCNGQNFLDQPARPTLPSRDVLLERYRLVQSIRSFSFWHGLTQSEGRAVLRDVGIDICEEVAKDWERDVSIRELSRRHGVTRHTVSNWIKKTGRMVPVANSRKRYDEEMIVETYRYTRSCNKAAMAAGVAWKTARSALERRGLWGGKSNGVRAQRLI
ncbi:hypothetical protein [Leisingera sp. NJS204]|uniref:hypothetical protein n=1 Tax=Leisingera sp. NJS204 TaxID=2508307 RepID=UPI0010102EB3|nr:hypothetical protein [Leisingera sp. NJS204]QAX28401.1 hypothetical protein ETW24_02870 [Leisingera sp. NJS204]